MLVVFNSSVYMGSRLLLAYLLGGVTRGFLCFVCSYNKTT